MFRCAWFGFDQYFSRCVEQHVIFAKKLDVLVGFSALKGYLKPGTKLLVINLIQCLLAQKGALQLNNEVYRGVNDVLNGILKAEIIKKNCNWLARI